MGIIFIAGVGLHADGIFSAFNFSDMSFLRSFGANERESWNSGRIIGTTGMDHKSGMVCRTREKYGKACDAGICANNLEGNIGSRSQLGHNIFNHYLKLLTIVLFNASYNC